MCALAVMPDRIKQAAKALPSAARVYARLQTLLQSSSADVADIVDLVRMDAGLASAVLQVSNSAHHRQGEPLRSVNEAINRVGLREVHRVVGIAVSGQLFVTALPLYRLSGQLLWENSLATATAMSLLARAAGEDERSAYTIGLLRGTGRLVLQRVASGVPSGGPAAPDSAAGARAESAWEHERFGASNAEVTAGLLADWSFPNASCVAVRTHLNLADHPAESRLAALLHLACWTASTLGKGLPSEAKAWRATPELTACAGLEPEAAQSCLVDARAELNRLGALVGRAA